MELFEQGTPPESGLNSRQLCDNGIMESLTRSRNLIKLHFTLICPLLLLLLWLHGNFLAVIQEIGSVEVG